MRKAFVLMLAIMVMLWALPVLASACTACDSAKPFHALLRASEAVVTSITHVAPAFAKIKEYQTIAPGGAIFRIGDCKLKASLINNNDSAKDKQARVRNAIPYARDAPRALSKDNIKTII